MRRSAILLILGASLLVPAVAAHWVPIGYAQTAATVQGDEFNATSFTAPFVVQCAPNATLPCPDAAGPNTWSLTANPGFLRIQTQAGTLVGTDTNNARNLVLQPVANASGDYTITTSLTFPGTGSPSASAIGQTAGIIVYQDADHFIYLGRAFNGINLGLPLLEFRQEDGAVERVNTVSEPTPPQATVYLRLVKTGTLYQGYYSYDNVTFTLISPGPAPTAVPTQTATSTSTPAATATATATATGTTTPAATATATTQPTSTATAAPTNTATATPNGYTASYASPQVGLFAWGGVNNVISADFDWFRVGSNSQTPMPTATTTGTPATATAAATAVPTATATAIATVPATVPPPPTATFTPAPTSTATAVPTATATATSVPAVPTKTPKPTHHKPTFGFSYVSAWYHFIRIGDRQHLQAQANIHSKQALWVTITFASGKKIHIWTQTNNGGFWQANVAIPANTIGLKSHRAWVTFQLWKGSLTTKRYAPFDVIRR